MKANIINKRIVLLLENEKNKKNSDRNQKALASATGIHFGTLSRWLLKDGDIPAKYIPLIAEFFNVSVDYLLGISDTKNQTAPPQKKEPGKRSGFESASEINADAIKYLMKAQDYFLELWKHLDSMQPFSGSGSEQEPEATLEDERSEKAGARGQPSRRDGTAVLKNLTRRMACFDYGTVPTESELFAMLGYMAENSLLDGEGLIRFESCIRGFLIEMVQKRESVSGDDTLTRKEHDAFRSEQNRKLAEVQKQIDLLNALSEKLEIAEVTRAVAELRGAIAGLAA